MAQRLLTDWLLIAQDTTCLAVHASPFALRPDLLKVCNGILELLSCRMEDRGQGNVLQTQKLSQADGISTRTSQDHCCVVAKQGSWQLRLRDGAAHSLPFPEMQHADRTDCKQSLPLSFLERQGNRR